MLSSFYMVVENLNSIRERINILLWVWINNLALSITLVNSLLHYTRTNCCHLWTVLWVNDSSNNVTTESRTDSMQHVVVVLATLLIVELTNLKLCTVGSKTRGQSC